MRRAIRVGQFSQQGRLREASRLWARALGSGNAGMCMDMRRDWTAMNVRLSRGASSRSGVFSQERFFLRRPAAAHRPGRLYPVSFRLLLTISRLRPSFGAKRWSGDGTPTVRPPTSPKGLYLAQDPTPATLPFLGLSGAAVVPPHGQTCGARYRAAALARRWLMTIRRARAHVPSKSLLQSNSHRFGDSHCRVHRDFSRSHV